MPDLCGGFATTQTPVVCGPWSVALAVGPDARPARLTQLAIPGALYEADRAAVNGVFERIVAAAVASSSPASVLEVLGGGVEGGVLWLAEAAPTGLSLADAVTISGPMAAEQVSSFLHSLAAALEPMHAAGLYHGWLCPHNVFSEGAAVRVGGWVWAYIMARVADVGGLELWPEAAYAAPEARRGGPPNGKTEVFSAAALAAFACSGMAPLDAGVVSGLPPVIEKALRTGMSTDAGKRYDGVKEMTVDMTVEQAISMTDQAETNAVPTGGDVPDWAHDLLAETLARREAGEPLAEVPPQPPQPAPQAPSPAPPRVVAEAIVNVEPAGPGKPAPQQPSGATVFEWNVGDQPGKSWMPLFFGVVSALFVILGIAITLVRHH